MIKIQSYGESILLVNFTQEISHKTNQKVHQLKEFLEQNISQGITFFIPAYCSLTIAFDRKKITVQDLKEKVQSFEFSGNENSITEENTIIHIPVCYHQKFALDMKEVQEITKLSKNEIISLHTSIEYKVYMIGFLPGFPYLGKLPDALTCPRKNKPRLKVLEGSVALANQQTGIYPSEAPGGWQIIGRTPLKIFDVNKENPFLLKAGDWVQFYEISEERYEETKNSK